jgi:hypothetical protein
LQTIQSCFAGNDALPTPYGPRSHDPSHSRSLGYTMCP